jgi:hypothetical protein
VSITTDVLLDELKGLRRGRAVYAPDISERVGDRLREVCGIDRSDPPGVIREKLTSRLGDLAGTLPDELRVATAAALAIHPKARHLLLQDRLRWLAEQMSRDGRTARRRVDEGFARLAEAAAGPRRTTRMLPDGSGPGWYVARFEAVLRMDLEVPVTHERRTVVAEWDGVVEIGLGLTLPREHGDFSDPELLVDVDFGGTLVRRHRAADDVFHWILALPEPLRAGETHEYGVTFSLPPGRPMRPHYVFTPARRCDEFDLRVRYGESAPSVIRRVEDCFHRELDGPIGPGLPLAPDSAGEVRATFSDLVVGFGYGIRWTLYDGVLSRSGPAGRWDSRG